MWIITGAPKTAAVVASPPLTVADIQKIAQDKLPKHVYNYYASGSDNEETLLRNITAFQRYNVIIFRQSNRTNWDVR